MKVRLLLSFLFITGVLSAQQPLSQSKRTSTYKFIYKISASEALELYKSNLHKIKEGVLYNLIDSFHINNEVPKLVNGNYILVHAVGNRLNYELLTIGDLQLKLVNNKRDLAVALHHSDGKNINEATVTLKNRKLTYDPKTETYRLNKYRKSGNLQVIFNNTSFYFPFNSSEERTTFQKIKNKAVSKFPIKNISRTIRKWKERNYNYANYFNHQVKHEIRFRGFMSFSKPIYKPGDTVRLKAFVMNKNGKAVNEKLLVRLTDSYLLTDTIIATIKPYRPGGFDYEFVLNENLDIDLDDRYMITLEEQRSRKFDFDEYDGNLDEEEYASKRKIVMRGKFDYEEYELQSISFSARSPKEEYSRGEQASIFLKAVDENNLPVMDGRLQIIVTTDNKQIEFNDPVVFLPDTLWTHSQPLENVGETKINLPDSIFPQASFHYQVNCIFLNSNNERQTSSVLHKFTNKTENFLFDFQNDSLRIDFHVKGKSNITNVTIIALNNLQDTIETFTLQLPSAFKINPFVDHYKVSNGSYTETYELKQTSGMVSALASRTKDSIFIVLNNPHRLPVWYTLFAGKKVISSGYDDTLALNSKTVTPKNYFLSLQYVFANKVYNEDYTIDFRDKLLKLTVNNPTVVHPGQTTKIEIGVTDINGQPVKDVDVTAYSYTSKFKNANTPTIPYLGKIFPYRKPGYSFTANNNNKWQHFENLNWQKWSKEFSLDTLEYYKFLYPGETYINKENADDSITQIAPFVVIDGHIQPIHLLYIDEKPYFFSHSQNLQRYSFRVNPGKHNLRIRTHDREIILKDLEVSKGIKTIISINGDTSNKKINVRRLPDILSEHEANLITKYSILMHTNFSEHLRYIKQGTNLFMLPGNQYNNLVQYSRIGPLSPQIANLVVHKKFEQSFDVESGYTYQVSPGLVKQKEINSNQHINKRLSHIPRDLNFSDLVLTENEIEVRWEEYLDNRSANTDLFYNSISEKKDNGALQIEISNKQKEEELPFVKNIFLFRNDDTDFIRIFKGKDRFLGFFNPGQYKLLILLKGDAYILKDSILIQKNGLNYYAVNTEGLRLKDSISTNLSTLIRERELANKTNRSDIDGIMQTYNAAYLDINSFTNEIFGQVRDQEGKPVPHVVVSVKGTRVGTVADENGFYRLRAPENGTLVFSSVGFNSTEQSITTGNLNAFLTQVDNNLQEVVVVGYGISRKKNLTASVSVLNGLAGSAAGILIRGAASVNGNYEHLIVIDGIPYNGKLEDLDPAMTASITTLKGEVGIALYGTRAANGVLLITTKKAANELITLDVDNPQSGNSLRRNFRDDAYWHPALQTDKEGKVRFSVTFPDDLTSWRTFAIAMGENKRTGFAEGMIRSFKPISVNLSIPPFALVGDSINVISKTLNYGADSISLTRKIKLNDQLIKEGQLNFKNSFIDTVTATIPDIDSMLFHVDIQKMDGYFDGEERTIPVFKQGVTETLGIFVALENDTTFSIEMDPALGEINLYAEASLFPVLLDEMEHLRRYEFLCNEQIASKLKALLSKKKVYKLLGKDFIEERLVEDYISRLNKNKTGNLWGWWANNEPSAWISLHVVEALLEAEKEGYKINLSKSVLTDYLLFNMENYRGLDKLLTIRLLQKMEAKVDYKTFIDSLQKGVNNFSLYELLRFTEIKQQADINIKTDSLIATSKQTLFGNLYWGEEKFSFFDNSVQNTLLMYRILERTGGHSTTLKKIRNYFLEKRKSGQWRNTYESSLILETILPGLVTGNKASRGSSISFSDLPGEEITTFPFQKMVDGGNKIQVTKKGDLPVYFTAYQQLWNKKPEAVANAFTVKSFFEKDMETITELKAGEPVNLKIHVIVKGDADYVLIDIPIPAGCSYQDKPQPNTNNEVHREYFKNKVSIFCSSLKQGSYSFIIPLLPRYNGRYNLNPAKAEMMYFPTFFGREGLRQVKIK